MTPAGLDIAENGNGHTAGISVSLSSIMVIILLLILAAAIAAAVLAGQARNNAAKAASAASASDSSVDDAGAPTKFVVYAIMTTTPTNAVIKQFNAYGQVTCTMAQIKAICVQTDSTGLAAIRARVDVASVGFEQEIDVPPTVSTTNFTGGTIDTAQNAAATSTDTSYLAALDPQDFIATGRSAWWSDQMNAVTFGNPAMSTTPDYTGEGVYVFVHDSGLVKKWTSYFPPERINTQYAVGITGGAGASSSVGHTNNAWGQDASEGHGTAVTACIIGYHIPHVYASLGLTGDVVGIAPRATIVPVAIYNANGKGYDTVHAASFLYTASLKAPGGPLHNSPVIINYSSGGAPSVLLRAAMDYAISVGVVFITAAGNNGAIGMDFPGAYTEAISAGSIGLTAQYSDDPFWFYNTDVPDPTDADDDFVSPFSGRELAGEQLDVLAPGQAILLPQVFQGHSTAGLNVWYGTSFSSPFTAATVALMLEANPALIQASIESLLKTTATPMPAPNCRIEFDLFTAFSGTQCWGTDATGSGIVDVLAAVTAAAA